MVQKIFFVLVVAGTRIGRYPKNRYMFLFVAKLTTSSRTWGGMSHTRVPSAVCVLCCFARPLWRALHSRTAPIYSGRTNQGGLGGEIKGYSGKVSRRSLAPCRQPSTPFFCRRLARIRLPIREGTIEGKVSVRNLIDPSWPTQTRGILRKLANLE